MNVLLPLSALYLAGFLISALILQVRSPVPPWEAGAPIESFTAGLLWMLSLISLLLASESLRRTASVLFWLGGSAALAILAIDEIWEFHERSSQLVGDDDPVKVVGWLASGGVLYWIASRETVSRVARRSLLVGFAFQSLWMLVELGDGDAFRLAALPIETLRTAEEVFELLFLSCYLVAFLHMLRERFAR